MTDIDTRRDPIVVGIPYFAAGAQGRELEFAVAGWRRHFKERHIIAIVGDHHPVCDSGDDIVFIDCPRIAPVDGQYLPALDVINKILHLRDAFPASEGFVWSNDDIYAVNDFDDFSDIVYGLFGLDFGEYLHARAVFLNETADFHNIPREKRDLVKVGIVGEIYVKFSPLGNNNLEQFLLKENVEPVIPGFVDFCLYCVYNGLVDYDLYRIRPFKAFGSKFLYRFLLKKQRYIRKMMQDYYPNFMPMADFDETQKRVKGYINQGAKMGEGWLLTAEMLELISEGVNNIICTQPFGCLPNHIAGKAMMKPIKERNQGVNIVAIDYDPGATAINQENRIKLMLSNAEH